MAAAAASPALQPPPGNPRFPLLDSMRGIAALCIVVTHATGASNFNADNPLGAYTARLNFGVTIFFLLSGFLLYRPMVAARREGRPPITIRDFTRRRVLRIIPAYWVAISVLAIYPGLLGFGDHWWRFYSFTQIYWLDSTSQGIFPAWTLCIEASFYVALPFLAAGVARWRPSVRGELLALLALAVAANGIRSGLQATGGFHVTQNTLLSYFDWFAYGMMLAVVSVATHRRQHESAVLRGIARRPWLPWLGAAIVYWVVSTQLNLSRIFYAVYTNWTYAGEHLLYALCALLLLLPCVFGDWAGGWPRRFLSWGWMRWLGLVSYGVFLYHGPIMLKINALGGQDWLPGSGVLSLLLTTLAFAVPAAAISYYVVERPALRFKDRRRVQAAPAPAPATPAAGPVG
jgi:peptidoglycan/LPS O-acetylase OafA/YrhL